MPPDSPRAVAPRLLPMLATATDALPTGPGWALEFKWDGVRALVRVRDGRVLVRSRNDRDVTASYPELAGLAGALAGHSAELDGEIVALDAGGRPSFSRLQTRMHTVPTAGSRPVPVSFLVFDLLVLDDSPLTALPYRRRREALESLALAGPHWQTTPWFDGGAEQVLAASRSAGLEGVVAKRLESGYAAGRRSPDWLKLPHLRTQEVLIGGWLPGEGRRAGLPGALLMGVNSPAGLRYVGRVGTGFTDAALAALGRDLAALAVADNPFGTGIDRPTARSATWVRPVLVGEVVYAELTPQGRLRQPRWRGLRPDKGPEEVGDVG